MSRHDLPVYKDMIELFLNEAPAISFKAISVPTKGIKSERDALHQLFYHLIIRGIETENETGRAVLPRTIQVWKDAEEEGSDRLLVASLDDKLKQSALSQFSNELFINEIMCVDSSKNVFMQIADLFSASANRIINRPSSQRNHKDTFAEFFLQSIGIEETFSSNENIGDMVVHISL
jgi:hypothetical protein